VTRLGKSAAFVVFVIFLASAAFAQVMMPPRGAPFVEESLKSEDRVPRTAEVARIIDEIEAHEAVILAGAEAGFEVTWKDPPQFFSGGKWARSGSRGLLDYRHSIKFKDGTRTNDCHRIIAFDGVKTDFLEFYPRIENSDIVQFREGHVGGVISADLWEIDGYPCPAALLGQTLKSRARYTLAEALREAREVTLRAEPEEVDGHKCHVLDFDIMGRAVGAGGYFPTQRSASIWIDAERDYRPVRIETYSHRRGRRELSMVIGPIELKEIDGVWLPVSGLKFHFRSKHVPDEGYTMEQLQAMEPDEAQKHFHRETVPSDLPPKTITVSSWRLGEIDEGLFTIDFPEGAEVWDEFRRKRYIVGSPEADEPADPGQLGFRTDPGWEPDRLCIYIDGGEPVTARIYFFSTLIEPPFRVVSAECSLENVKVAVEEPDEGGIRNPVKVTAAPTGKPGRRYGRITVTPDPPGFGEVEVPVMICERAAREKPGE